jgi:hypothetical protein
MSNLVVGWRVNVHNGETIRTSGIQLHVLTFSSLQNDLVGGVSNFPGMRGTTCKHVPPPHSKSEVKGTAVKLRVCMKSQISRQIRLFGNNSALGE